MTGHAPVPWIISFYEMSERTIRPQVLAYLSFLFHFPRQTCMVYLRPPSLKSVTVRPTLHVVDRDRGMSTRVDLLCDCSTAATGCGLSRGRKFSNHRDRQQTCHWTGRRPSTSTVNGVRMAPHGGSVVNAGERDYGGGRRGRKRMNMM
jgi:hypothetical protein